MWAAVAEVRRETVLFVGRMPEFRRQHERYEATVGEGPIWLCEWEWTASTLGGLAETLHVLEAGMVYAGERPPVHLPIPAPEEFHDAHALLTARVYDLAGRLDAYLVSVGAAVSGPLAGERTGDAFYAGLRCCAWAARQACSVLNGEVSDRHFNAMWDVLQAAEIDAEWPGLATA